MAVRRQLGLVQKPEGLGFRGLGFRVLNIITNKILGVLLRGHYSIETLNIHQRTILIIKAHMLQRVAVKR